MGLTLEIQTKADSAHAHYLASLFSGVINDDKGLIPQADSDAWYEHLVASDAEGEATAEALVLLITPAKGSQEGLKKWEAISEAVRGLLSDCGEVRPLTKGTAQCRKDLHKKKDKKKISLSA